MAKEDGDGRPTREMVVDLAHEEFGRHAKRRSENDEMMRMVNREIKPFARPPDPALWTPVIPGTAGSLIHRAAAQLVAEVPIVTYHARNESPTAMEESDKIEMFGRSILDGITNSQMIPPFEDAAKRSLLGMWCLKGPLFDFDVWGDHPKRSGKTKAEYDREMARYYLRQAEHFPFIVKSVNPNNVVWDESNPMNPRWAIERYTTPRFRLEKMFPDAYAKTDSYRRKKANDSVWVHEYWSPKWRMVLADDEEVPFWSEGEGETRTGAIENVYGFQPYQFGFGAWGFSSTKPEDMAKSLLWWIRDDIYEEARVASLKSWQMSLYGMTPLVTANAERLREELGVGPGAVLTSDNPEDVGKGAPRPLEMPVPPPWLSEHEDRVSGRISQNTFSRSMLGERSPGTTSGVMGGLQIGESKTQFRTITKRLEAQSARILNRCALIIETLVDEKFSVWAQMARGRELITLSPDVWKGAYHYHVALEPVDPARDDRRGMLGLNFFTANAIDPWTFLEDYARHPNATEVLKRKMLWQVMNSPEFMAVLAGDAAEAFGLDERLKELQQEAAGAEGAPEISAEFDPLDLAGGGNTIGLPMNTGDNAGPELPTRDVLEGQGRLSPSVTGPLQTRESAP